VLDRIHTLQSPRAAAKEIRLCHLIFGAVKLIRLRTLRRSAKKRAQTHKSVSATSKRANFLSHPQLFAIAIVEMETDAIKMVLPMGRAGGWCFPAGDSDRLNYIPVLTRCRTCRVAGRGCSSRWAVSTATSTGPRASKTQVHLQHAMSHFTTGLFLLISHQGAPKGEFCTQ
jgi:hypothetical protein